MKSCRLQYDKTNQKLIFDCNSTELLPSYLHYLLIYHNLPETATMVFKDQSVRLIKVDQNYKYERI